MKLFLTFLLLTSAMSVWSQADMEEDPEVIQEETIFPEENYEAEMFQQKQEEYTYSAGQVTDSVEEAMEYDEVYESESDY